MTSRRLLLPPLSLLAQHLESPLSAWAITRLPVTAASTACQTTKDQLWKVQAVNSRKLRGTDPPLPLLCQMARRETFSKIPLQGNYYPMPELAFLQDTTRRFSVHTRQAVGVASLKPGWLEMMIDRRLVQVHGPAPGRKFWDKLCLCSKHQYWFVLIEERVESLHLCCKSVFLLTSLGGVSASIAIY